MSNFPHYPPHIVHKKSTFHRNLSVRIKLIIFLSAAAGIAYMFMLYFKNEAQCERLEPKHVVCQQYRTSFDYAKSIFWKSYAEESKIDYRLMGTKRSGNKLYLETDQQPILYLYEPTEYNDKIPDGINKVESFINGWSSRKKVLSLANSRDRGILLYYLWGFPSFFLFVAELYARKQAEINAE